MNGGVALADGVRFGFGDLTDEESDLIRGSFGKDAVLILAACHYSDPVSIKIATKNAQALANRLNVKVCFPGGYCTYQRDPREAAGPRSIDHGWIPVPPEKR
jgi:hypothetical protein